MSTTTNSSFKVKCSTVDSTTGLVPEKGAMIFDLSTGEYKVGTGTAWLVVLSAPYPDTYWVDLLGPVTAARIDSASTRYEVDFFNGTVNFHADARYPEEPVLVDYQLLHEWEIGSDGKLHFHWKQRSADIPNWLIAFKVDVNGEAGAIETDYSNWTFRTIASHAFTYTAGVLNQISSFGDIDLSSANLSSLIKVIVFRDTANASGEFAGADPSALEEHLATADIHIEVNAPGSMQEFIK